MISRIIVVVKYIGKNCLDLIFPDRCLLCDDVLSPSHGDCYICKSCEDKITLCHTKHQCAICSLPLEDTTRFLCPTCMAFKRNFTRNVSAAIYEGAFRETILNFKFNNCSYHYKGLASLIIQSIESCSDFPEVNLVLCVPIHKSRLESRGYNQSALIAKEIARRLELPFLEDAIMKSRETKTQSRTGSLAERRENVRGAFRADNNANLRDKTILLIDDIYTTGETLNEVSRILLRAGAKEVVTATAAIVNPYKRRN